MKIAIAFLVVVASLTMAASSFAATSLLVRPVPTPVKRIVLPVKPIKPVRPIAPIHTGGPIHIVPIFA